MADHSGFDDAALALDDLRRAVYTWARRNKPGGAWGSPEMRELEAILKASHPPTTPPPEQVPQDSGAAKPGPARKVLL